MDTASFHSRTNRIIISPKIYRPHSAFVVLFKNRSFNNTLMQDGAAPAIEVKTTRQAMKLYRLYFQGGTPDKVRKFYCGSSNRDFPDNHFFEEIEMAGKFQTKVANRIIRESRLNLIKEIVEP